MEKISSRLLVSFNNLKVVQWLLIALDELNNAHLHYVDLQEANIKLRRLQSASQPSSGDYVARTRRPKFSRPFVDAHPRR